MLELDVPLMIQISTDLFALTCDNCHKIIYQAFYSGYGSMSPLQRPDKKIVASMTLFVKYPVRISLSIHTVPGRSLIYILPPRFPVWQLSAVSNFCPAFQLPDLVQKLPVIFFCRIGQLSGLRKPG